MEGAEADDFIARWIEVHPDDDHIIVSSDRDFFQLLSDNVKIYDGIRGWTITTEGYFDEDDKPVKTKKKVNSTDKNGAKIKKTVDVLMEKPDPEYELFKKIIRGDSSDNIMSAYPGVRENGSSKKPGIREAFEDRNARGFNWNNFMLQEWNKIISLDDSGNPTMEKVTVSSEYQKNKKLIDLKEQPLELKAKMDDAIVDAINKPKVPLVGIHLLRFAEEMALNTIVKNPTEIANMFAAPYSK